MEVTIRRGPDTGPSSTSHLFSAAVAFHGHGPRALERIRLAPTGASYREVMKQLTTGFRVNPSAHVEGTVNYRVLKALCVAPGVENLDG